MRKARLFFIALFLLPDRLARGFKELDPSRGGRGLAFVADGRDVLLYELNELVDLARGHPLQPFREVENVLVENLDQEVQILRVAHANVGRVQGLLEEPVELVS